MEEILKIYIDRLTGGATEKICGSIPVGFLRVQDGDVDFKEEVEVLGEAYLAEKTLIVQLKVRTVAETSCVICSNPWEFEVKLSGVYITVALEEIKGRVFDLTNKLREEVLLEIPHYLECHGGNCPSRKEITKYLVSDVEKSDNENYRPFSDL